MIIFQSSKILPVSIVNTVGRVLVPDKALKTR